MEYLLYFYIGFSYLFLIGSRTAGNLPRWNILFAPVVFPILLGRMCNIITQNIQK